MQAITKQTLNGECVQQRLKQFQKHEVAFNDYFNDYIFVESKYSDYEDREGRIRTTFKESFVSIFNMRTKEYIFAFIKGKTMAEFTKNYIAFINEQTSQYSDMKLFIKKRLSGKIIKDSDSLNLPLMDIYSVMYDCFINKKVFGETEMLYDLEDCIFYNPEYKTFYLPNEETALMIGVILKPSLEGPLKNIMNSFNPYKEESIAKKIEKSDITILDSIFFTEFDKKCFPFSIGAIIFDDNHCESYFHNTPEASYVNGRSIISNFNFKDIDSDDPLLSSLKKHFLPYKGEHYFHILYMSRPKRMSNIQQKRNEEISKILDNHKEFPLLGLLSGSCQSVLETFVSYDKQYVIMTDLLFNKHNGEEYFFISQKDVMFITKNYDGEYVRKNINQAIFFERIISFFRMNNNSVFFNTLVNISDLKKHRMKNFVPFFNNEKFIAIIGLNSSYMEFNKIFDSLKIEQYLSLLINNQLSFVNQNSLSNLTFVSHCFKLGYVSNSKERSIKIQESLPNKKLLAKIDDPLLILGLKMLNESKDMNGIFPIAQKANVEDLLKILERFGAIAYLLQCFETKGIPINSVQKLVMKDNFEFKNDSISILNMETLFDLCKNYYSPAYLMSIFEYLSCDSPKELLNNLDVFFLFMKSIIEKYNNNCPIIENSSIYDMADTISMQIDMSKFQGLKRLLHSYSYCVEKTHVTYAVAIKECHDEEARTYRAIENAILNEKYQKLVHSYEKYKLIDTDKNLGIWAAPKLSDIVKEGKDLNHCVASYTSRVAKGETSIFFLRNADNPNKSLYTVEVKNQAIRQIHGHSNSNLSDPQIIDFVKDWCRKNRIAYNPGNSILG